MCELASSTYKESSSAGIWLVRKVLGCHGAIARGMPYGPAKSNTMQSVQHPQHRMAIRMAKDKVQVILD